MTDETLTGGPVQRPSGGGLAGVVAPEGVAAILAIVVVVALLGSRLVSGGGTAVPTPSPSPTPVATATPTPGVDVGAINLLLGVNHRLAEQAVVIQRQLDAKQVDPPTLQTSFRKIVSELTNTGDAAVRQLAASPGGAEVAKAVGIVYADLREQANKAINGYSPNDYSPKSLLKWRASAADVAKILESIPGLDTQLEALKASGGQPSPSAAVSPSLTPSASAGPPSVAPFVSAAPPPTVTPVTPPPATPSPTVSPVASPSGSPVLGPNLIQNGSFEAGVDTLWKLVRADPAAAASVSAETTTPYSPKVAAKIDIQAASNRQIGIAYQQAGFPIQAGARYLVTIALKSTDLRSVRIRIADAATSQLLGSKPFQIGAGWTLETFDFSSFIGSDFAVFSIDVGESAQPVWVDDVSLARIPPG